MHPLLILKVYKLQRVSTIDCLRLGLRKPVARAMHQRVSIDRTPRKLLAGSPTSLCRAG